MGRLPPRLLRINFAAAEALASGDTVQASLLSMRVVEEASALNLESATLSDVTAIRDTIMALAASDLGEALPPSCCSLAASLSDILSMHSDLGDLVTCAFLCDHIEELFSSLECLQTHLPGIRFLYTLAVVERDLGRPLSAVTFAQAAQRNSSTLLLQSPDPKRADVDLVSLLADSSNVLSQAYSLLGRNHDAWRANELAAGARRALGDTDEGDRLSALQNRALLLKRDGRFSEAEDALLEVIETMTRAGQEDTREFATALANLGTLYQAAHLYQPAERYLRWAIQIRKQQAPLVDSIEYAMCLNTLGIVCGALGNHTEAETLLLEAIARMRRDPFGRNFSLTWPLLALGTLYSLSHEHRDNAILLICEALAIDEVRIERAFETADERDQMSLLRSLRADLDHLFSAIIHVQRRASIDDDSTPDELPLRWKSMGMAVGARWRELARSSPEAHRLWKESSLLDREIAEAELRATLVDGDRNAVTPLQEARDEKQRAFVSTTRLTNFVQTLRADVTAGRLRERLSDHTVLVEYFRFSDHAQVFQPERGIARILEGDRYLASVWHASGVEWIDLGTALHIDTEVRAFLDVLCDEGDEGELPDWMRRAVLKISGTSLRQLVWDPVSHLIQGRAVVLAPDGELMALAFETLPLDGDRYLIDEFRISYVGVGRDLLKSPRSVACRPNPPLVIADPDSSIEEARSEKASEEDVGWLRLPGARHEGLLVAALLGVDAITGSAATKGRILDCVSPAIIHIATHGFQLDDFKAFPLERDDWIDLARLLDAGEPHPLLRSGLVLAPRTGASDSRVDRLLTALEISTAELLDTELVFLSSCGSGKGWRYAGEGVFDLRRAFSIAGVRTIIAALWGPIDKISAELIGDFYRRLLQGAGKGDALREAKLLIKASHPDPGVWGAFICHGDTEPVDLRWRQEDSAAVKQVTNDPVMRRPGEGENEESPEQANSTASVRDALKAAVRAAIAQIRPISRNASIGITKRNDTFVLKVIVESDAIASQIPPIINDLEVVVVVIPSGIRVD